MFNHMCQRVVLRYRRCCGHMGKEKEKDEEKQKEKEKKKEKEKEEEKEEDKKRKQESLEINVFKRLYGN